MTIKNWKPKKRHHKYKDFRQLCVYCIKEYGCSTPEEAGYRITEGDWMHPDSDHSDAKAIIKACQKAWDGAKRDIDKVNKEDEQKRLTEPEKLAKAVEYVKTHVVYDTFKNSFLERNSLEEVSPSDMYIRYNDLVSDKLYIQKFFFDTAFESVQIPKHDPIKIWSDGLPKWNGKTDHIKKLCGFIPAKNPRQLELFLKAWLIRSYIQTVNPFNKPAIEIVNRHFLILQSNLESSGKSSFLSWLSPYMDWVKISGIEAGKDGKRVLAAYMIVVDDEMYGITQFKEAAAFKSLISMSKVDVRLPYAKKDSALPRIASFCGSCNPSRLFPVGEQHTRFLCVPLEDKMIDYKGYMKNINKDMLWGQVKVICTTNWLDKNDAEIRELRTITNASFERETMEQLIVEDYVRPTVGKEVMRTGDIINKVKEQPGFENTNLNINVLGSILTKTFGPPVKGYIGGVRTYGYQVEFVQPVRLLAGQKDKKGGKRALFKKPN